MQHLQYGINSLSKLTIARRLPLLRRTLTSFLCLLLDRRFAIFPPSDGPRLRFDPPADHARATNDRIVLYCNEVHAGHGRCSGTEGKSVEQNSCVFFVAVSKGLRAVKLFCSEIFPGCFIHTHTHTLPFNGPFSGTTQVSRYQKGKTNLDFSEARDSE